MRTDSLTPAILQTRRFYCRCPFLLDQSWRKASQSERLWQPAPTQICVHHVRGELDIQLEPYYPSAPVLLLLLDPDSLSLSISMNFVVELSMLQWFASRINY